MRKPNNTGQKYDVILVDGDIYDEMAPRIYFRLVSKEETEALLSIALRQRDMEILISNGRA